MAGTEAAEAPGAGGRWERRSHPLTGPLNATEPDFWGEPRAIQAATAAPVTAPVAPIKATAI